MSRTVYSLQFFKSTITFLFLIFILLGSVSGQEKEEEPVAKAEVIVDAIAINDISIESEKLGQRIFKLRAILEPSSEIEEVDSLLNSTSTEIKLKRDSLFLTIDDMSQRRLKIRKVEWENYKSKLKSYQTVLNGRLTNVTKTNEELVKEIKKWTVTKESFSENKESAKIYSNIDTVIYTLQDIMQISLVRLDSIFLIQKSLTDLILSVDEVISEIGRMERQLQKDYFVFDSPALWNYNKIDSIATDTTAKYSTNSFKSIKSGIAENITPLKEFLGNNVKTVIFQVLFLLLMFMLLLVVKKHWKRGLNELTTLIERDAKIVLDHPIAATLAAGLIISIFFYKTRIPIFTEIHIVVILAATAFLLPLLTTKRFNIFLLLLFVVYIIQSFEIYLNPHSFLVRLLLLFDAFVLITALIYGKIEIRNNPQHFLRINAIFKFLVPIYILFLLAAIIANIIGMVNLSRFLVVGVMSSTTLGIVVFLTVKVITSILVLLFKLISLSNPKALQTMVTVTQQRLKPILLFIGLIVWLMFTLISFEIYDILFDYLKEILLIEWQIGKMTISLGGILSFGGILLITILIAKLGAAIFEDDWMIEILPRGIAPAISLILRIIVISVGFYAALLAAGIDLGKLGFIVGALGVGIGFGLQNVVLNFIAGLILAFERPINLGDTIEVDQEMGVVTGIGVRSSHIKTFTGAEAIIPNGDLISKKVINWTLTNRDRRTKVLMKTSASADPIKVIELFNKIASEHPTVYKNPAPMTHFYGFNVEGNLDFALLYWTSFSNTLNTDHDIALKIYTTLKEEGIQAPLPVRRIVSGKHEL